MKGSLGLYFSILLIALFVWPRSITPAQQTQQISVQTTKKLHENIKFETARNLIFVRTRLNNSKPLWFILDSGASVSVINDKIARSLGLKLSGKNKIKAVGGMIKYSLVKGVSFDVSGAALTNQTIAAIDLGVLEPSFGRNIDGIIGAEFFNRFVVKIDYAAEMIDLYDPADFQSSDSGDVIGFEIENNTPFIRAELSANGTDFIDGKFLVDTGAISSLYINKPFEQQHNLLHSLDITIPEPFTNHLGGELSGRVGRMKKMRIGNFMSENAVTHFFEPGNASGSNSTSTRDGIIGGGFFKKFTVILDYSRKQLILKPNKNFTAPFEFDQSGLDLAAVGANFETITVRKVLANSPASTAGLRAGDVIVSISGKASNEFSIDMIDEMFSHSGREYELTVLRENKLLKTIIKLRYLI